MSSEEDDYMSDAFLNVKSSTEGLPKRKQDQRDHEIYKKKIKAEENPPVKAKQKEHLLRETGLNTAISNENKGFKMLEKMGYKPGTSLGKANTGLLEPINVVLKNERSGLGKAQQNKEKVEKLVKRDIREIENKFKKSLYEKKKTRQLRKFFNKAQTSCEYLDKSADVTYPVKDYFWPKEAFKTIKKEESQDSSEEDSEEESEEEEEVISETYLIEIVEYLRATYFYCIYCAAKGTDENDLQSFCPGPHLEDHDEFD